MGLSGEEMELVDPSTPWRRKLRIRLRRIWRETIINLMLFWTVVLLVILAAIIYFGFPYIWLMFVE